MVEFNWNDFLKAEKSTTDTIDFKKVYNSVSEKSIELISSIC